MRHFYSCRQHNTSSHVAATMKPERCMCSQEQALQQNRWYSVAENLSNWAYYAEFCHSKHLSAANVTSSHSWDLWKSFETLNSSYMCDIFTHAGSTTLLLMLQRLWNQSVACVARSKLCNKIADIVLQKIYRIELILLNFATVNTSVQQMLLLRIRETCANHLRP